MATNRLEIRWYLTLSKYSEKLVQRFAHSTRVYYGIVIYSLAFTVRSSVVDALFSKLSIICCMLSAAVAGKVALPSSAIHKQEASRNHNRDKPKFVSVSHFETTSSGVNLMFMGKPCPPVRCHRVSAAQPPEISNSRPVVSVLSSLVRNPTTGAM